LTAGQIALQIFGRAYDPHSEAATNRHNCTKKNCPLRYIAGAYSRTDNGKQQI